MDILIIAFFLLFGIILLLVEIFFLPGISIAGIAGIIFMIGGVIYGFTISSTVGFVTLIISIVTLVLGIWYFMRSRMLDKLSLHTEIESSVEPFDSDNVKVGDRGITVSRLAPMGKVKINNTLMEAKSLYDFIDENCEIEVVAIYKTNVQVKLVSE